MGIDDAGDRIEGVRQMARRSARLGASGATLAVAALLIAVSAIVDLDMVWLAGLVILGFVGLSMARPLRLRLDWSDSLGASLVVGGAVFAGVADVAVQLLARTQGWAAPNTLGGLAAALAVLAICRPGLVRLASPGYADRHLEGQSDA